MDEKGKVKAKFLTSQVSNQNESKLKKPKKKKNIVVSEKKNLISGPKNDFVEAKHEIVVIAESETKVAPAQK